MPHWSPRLLRACECQGFASTHTLWSWRGNFLGQTLIQFLSFNVSQKYLGKSIWCTFLNCFKDVKNPTKWKESTIWWPQTYWSLKGDKVANCDIILLLHYKPIRELCRSWSHTLQSLSFTSALKMPPRNSSRSSDFLSINIFLDS